VKLWLFSSNRYQNGHILDSERWEHAMTNTRKQSQHADPEFQTWSLLHARDNRLHGAELAQITQHHDPNPAGDALHQLQAWARRQAREKQLQASAIAHLRYCPPVPNQAS